MRTPAPRAPLGSPPAADTRNGVRQQTRAVRGAGAALPRCLGPRSADLKRAPSNFSKSGRDGRRGAAAQHTHYGAVHMDAGQPRAMRSSSAPPGACSARSRAPHALSSRLCARFSARFSERQTRAIFRPKNINNMCFTENEARLTTEAPTTLKCLARQSKTVARLCGWCGWSCRQGCVHR
jgi:hypothetical protein